MPVIPDGTVAVVDGQVVLRYERRYAYPVERIWSALTDPDELPVWWGAAMPELVPGGEFVLQWLNTDDEGNVAIMHATVTALAAPTLFELESDVHGRLRWTLRSGPDGDDCVLTLVNDTPAPDDFILKALAGWHVHLDQLDDHLAGQDVDWSTWTMHTRSVTSGLSWSDHYDRYARRLEQARR